MPSRRSAISLRRSETTCELVVRYCLRALFFLDLGDIGGGWSSATTALALVAQFREWSRELRNSSLLQNRSGHLRHQRSQCLQPHQSFRRGLAKPNPAHRSGNARTGRPSFKPQGDHWERIASPEATPLARVWAGVRPRQRRRARAPKRAWAVLLNPLPLPVRWPALRQTGSQE
jgi:hypothetical protein